MSKAPRVAVIGAGVTGLAVGAASGAPVFEQSDRLGGICRSYYVRPGSDELLDHAPRGQGAYRFEVGGGHWLFGGDSATIARLHRLVDFRVHERRAVVRLGSLGLTVPYPLQAHVDALGAPLADTIRHELEECAESLDEVATLREWLRLSFGGSLCDLFFYPFHDRYTAGLTGSIAPQDRYKSPATGAWGYNASFRYPVGGLDVLVARLADGCDIRYGRRLVGIDRRRRVLQFADGTEVAYDHVVSTVPLHRAVAIAGLDVDDPPDPHTSALVVNIGAERGPACPNAHWQYEPDSRSGFHRIGFYSNVDPEFLAGCRSGSHVSMYVERAVAGGYGLSPIAVDRYVASVVEELQARGYLARVEVVHPSWVDVAYTWRARGSRWREQALHALARAGIQQVGRYGRWHFQGIADSMQEGHEAGRALPR